MSNDIISLAIEVVLILSVFYFLRRTYNIFESIVIVDIFLRVVNYIFSIFSLNGVLETIANILPASIEALINTITKGTLNQVLLFGYFACFVIFLVKAVKRAV